MRRPTCALLLVAAAAAATRWPVAWLLLGAPVAEELVFRAGLQEALARHMATPRAVLLASALFAAAHVAVSPTVLAALSLLPSLALGAAYATRGRLQDAVGLHVLFNSVWLLCGADALEALQR